MTEVSVENRYIFQFYDSKKKELKHYSSPLTKAVRKYFGHFRSMLLVVEEVVETITKIEEHREQT